MERDFKTSIELCQKAIDLEPWLFFSYNIAFQITEAAGDLEKAKEIAQKAVAINPDWSFEIK